MNNNTNLHTPGIAVDTRLAGLSPAKRALLQKRLALSNNDQPQAHRPHARAVTRDLNVRLVQTPIVPVARGCSIPLSFAQQRLWLVDRILPDKAAYNIPTAWRLHGRLDLSALQHGFNRVVARHEALRTHFAMTDAGPVQVITPAQAVALPFTDLSTLEPEAREARAREITNAEAQQPFDLAKAPMLRAQLVRLAAEEHILLLNVHHIASDGWSVGVFERELSVAYAAFVKGHEPQLPVLPIQYADYAIWQREWLQGEVLQSQLGYWSDKLADLSTLELPTDRPRPAVQSHRGAHLAFDLPAPLTEALKALGRREGATLFMTLIAAFKVLLYRYSGQEDIAVGTPIAGRRQTELEGLIGFFVNTLVLRSDLTDNPSFRELLARVRETALGAYTHQDLPFEKLVEELAPARDLSRDPLFQVMFILQNTPEAALSLDDVTISRLPLSAHTAKFDLTVSVRESEQGLRAIWEYATDLFDAATIERMAGHFKQLLEAIVADPEQRIGELPILTAAERHQLLVEWNDTATDYPRDRCIHQLFEEQVARTPNAVAVVFEDQQLTYAELNARANQLAHHLISLGVGPEVLVGICLERSVELIVGLLAILKAGGAYVPLDPTYPRERLAFMLEDTQAPVLITAHKLLEQLPDYQGHLLCIDRDWTRLAEHPDTNAPCHTSAENLAYVIYTSGSTGRPKGVAIPHRGVLRLALNNDYVPINSQQTFLLLSPISFDASTFELWGALLNGARCAIFNEQVPTIETLGLALEQYQVRTLWLTASLFNFVVDEAPRILGEVRQLLTGGEALSPTHVRAALKHLPNVLLVNGYGPTENTTFTCCYRLPKVLDATWLSIPIGRPIRNTWVYLLDRHFQPVPVGVTGEIYIAGDGVAQGYLNRPALTAEKFLPDPFCKVAGARMYRTGDLARYRPDGNIEFIGRADDQLKIRGYRIELGEIETVLAEHPAVRQAVVLAREDVPGDKRLVAYVVPADPTALDIETLRGFLRARLPEYMRPAAYVLIKALPLNANGKIDRKALPASSQGLLGIPESYAAPGDQIEQTLSTIWGQTLGIERVGIDDNFFEIGGHSLLAAKLFSRLDRALNRSLPLATLFESPTIRELAVFYRDGENPANRSALVPIVPIGALPPIFAVPGVGGNVLGFAELVRSLGPEQRFFGLQSIGLDGNREPLQTIEQMATEYIRELRQVQPCGPYYLMGACFGSAVAYEMAHQLLSSGEKVAFLGLIDPSFLTKSASTTRPLQLPSWLHRGIALARFVLGRIQLYREEMKLISLSEQLRFLGYKTQLLGAAFQARDVFRGDRREFLQSRVTDTNLRAIQRYRHKELGGGAMAVEIFVSDSRFDRLAVHSNAGWERLTGTTVMYHRMSGKDSGDMLRGDNAKKFAMLFRERLKRARIYR